jgi:hypothetical protein
MERDYKFAPQTVNAKFLFDKGNLKAPIALHRGMIRGFSKLLNET